MTPEIAALSAKWGSTHAIVANSLRSLICAAPGHRLMAADYSNIEGRGLAWLAGERWKLAAFRDFDAGKGADLYKVAYSRAFGVEVSAVSDDERQIGKVQELALGYAGSIGAFLSMGANYNIDLDQIARIASCAVDPDDWQAACDAYDRIRYDGDEDAEAEDAEAEDESDNPDLAFLEPFKGDPRRGLPREQWAAIRCIVRGWRAAHPATVAWWQSLEAAAISAVDAWGTVHHAGPVSFSANRSALRCRLPSGRHLTYPFPRVIRGVSKKSGKPQTVLLYMAAKGASRTWRPTRAYGGYLAENVTQATARDALADALLALEDHGYATVMHVHDEIVCEVPNGVGDVHHFRRICEILPPWAEGLPLVTGEPWEGARYRK